MTPIRQINGKLLGATALAVAAIIIAAGVWAIGIDQSSAATSATATPPKDISLVNGPAAELSPKQQKGIDSVRRTLASVDFGELHAAGGGVWMANATGKSCVFVQNGEGIGAGCATTANTEAGLLGFTIRSMTSDASEIVGVVPDDVTSVTVADAAGSTVDTSTVHNNVYRVKGSGLRSLTLHGGSTSTIALAG